MESAPVLVGIATDLKYSTHRQMSTETIEQKTSKLGRRVLGEELTYALSFPVHRHYNTSMTATLDTMTTDGRVVISFPEGAISAKDREDFLSLIKAEWRARQSCFTSEDATAMANEVDNAWWSRNKARILASIGEQ